MGKIAKVQEVPIVKLKPYDKNAKIHGPEQIEKLKSSISEFGFLSPCLIDQDYNLIAGHGRIEAAKQLGISSVPCVFIEGLTDEQRRAYILADNKLGELGTWEMDMVDLELAELSDLDFDVTLTGFEWDSEPSSSWFESRERFDREKEEGNEEYNEFLEKFEIKKTSDDCYTPDNIYDAVVEYVEELSGKGRDKFVRPFYPGGDYQNEKYKKGCVVVDNPPFSILAEIIDFYIEKGIDFFLFAPGVSTLGYTTRPGITAVCSYGKVTYENGANVMTNFITNLIGDDVAAINTPELTRKIEQLNSENEAALHKSLPKYDYPDELITTAKLGYLSKYGQELRISRKDSCFVRGLDAQKESGKAIFGGGLLLSEKAAAEKAAAEKFPLSDREREIVRSLG